MSCSRTEYMRKWRLAHPEKVRQANQQGRKYYQLHREEILAERYRDRVRISRVTRRRRLEIKTKVLTYYGGGKLICVMCGFDKIKALSIDHTEGGGNKHRKELGHTSADGFYRWLIKNNFPKGYQTLCLNCQRLK